MIVRAFAASALIASGAGMAVAQEQSVGSLLKDGFTIAGVIQSSAGPGLFLQKGDRLMLCVVTETPSSADVTTRYCKPVR
ncbi:hypothetical protein [Bradyrhizobium sp. LHD-71]|uniref:hypothetical protein n=1 Tax=Bradyrhizobium sp. LHD-71 TaxID=3072141 RepID=UPI002810043D|nr:hypothetical protein [Bradyrhizobium sp. LHD-71]MDQ8728739.1 hypothetical protein [Bradyrhizobium sp. LHD-71]